MNRETPGVGSAGHKEEGKTGSWKSPAQNTIDSPGLRRALNGRLDTEQDDYAALTRSTSNKEMGKEINKYFNKNERFICIIEKNCVTLQKFSIGYEGSKSQRVYIPFRW